MNIKEVESLIEPIISNLGYELVEVEYKKKYNAMNLYVYIDKDGGVTLDDCEIVHKAIDTPLDELDPTEGQSYILSVSSPGIDRPLKQERDFKRNLGKLIEISLYAADNGNKSYQGTLTSWDNDSVTITIDNNTKSINKNRISIIRPII